MHYIEAPNDISGEITSPSIFLAGGITNVRDWQSQAVAELQQFDDLYVFNPRRQNFDDFKKNSGFAESERQIRWEDTYLSIASQIIFWFSHETLQPIVLFELGKIMSANRFLYGPSRYQEVFLGVDPNYPRRFDVTIQAKLLDPTIEISDSLEGLLTRVVCYNKILAKTPSLK